ncbi:hypothetical protein EOD39_17616, partial [Acipenser ruthenus]
TKEKTITIHCKIFFQHEKTCLKRKLNLSSQFKNFHLFLQQTLFTISVFAVTLLTPAGWILHHLPEYRKR